MRDRILGYVCTVDYDHELGECDITVYATVESLKEKCKCWSECGIVQMRVVDGKFKLKQIEPQKPFASGKK